MKRRRVVKPWGPTERSARGASTHRCDAALRPALEAVGPSTSALRRREAPLRSAGRRNRGRGWRARARRRSWVWILLGWCAGGHVGKFISETFAKVLSGPMHVGHGRAFRDLEDFGNLGVFHLLDGAKQQTGAGHVGDGVE